MHSRLSLLCLLALAPLSSFAGPTSLSEVTVVGKRFPPALSGPVNAGLEIIKSFPARSDLTGWVWKDGEGQHGVFFTTRDGESLLLGPVLSENGENWTERYTDQYVPKPDLNALWAKFEKANYVVSGTLTDPASVIYAILDPNCVFCYYLSLALEPYLKSGLQVRWIPVGFLREDSASKAAAFLQGGENALKELQVKFEHGGLPGIEVTADLKVKLDANLALMREANIRGTPGVLYKDSEGHVQLREGMPKLDELSQLTRLNVTPSIDTRLERFK